MNEAAVDAPAEMIVLTERRAVMPGGTLVIKDVDTRPAPKRWFTWALDKLMDPRAPVHYWPADALTETIVRAGEEGEDGYLIVSGSADVWVEEKQARKDIATVGPGERDRQDSSVSLHSHMLAHACLPESDDALRPASYCRPIRQTQGPRNPMKFFADTAEIAEIRELAETGLLDGVTTNPSLIHKAGRNFLEVVREIAGVVKGPVSAEVVALDYDGMMREAEVLRKIACNIAIKVPLTPAGLKACKALTSDGSMVNVTLCFSAAQALLAAKAGASFISPFVGRHDDVGRG